ncbi:MAG: tetratricopeptide repeat protein, partial [Chloroflexota bacterium]
MQDRDREWQALHDLGILWLGRDYMKAGALLQEALELAREVGDDRKIARSLNRYGNWRVNVGDPRRAREAHQEALVIFERLNDKTGLAETLDLLGLASYLTADFRGSVATFKQAIPLFRKLGDVRGLSSSLAMMALSGGTFDSDVAVAPPGSPEQWAGYSREAIDHARRIGWRAGEAFAMLVHGVVLAVHGEPGEALDVLERAKEVAESIGHRQWGLASTHQLGVLGLRHYCYEFAELHLTDALRQAKELGSSYWTRSVISHLADLYLDTDHLAKAESLIGDALGTDDAIDGLGQRKLWLRLARLELARGNPSRALSIADRLIATAPGWRRGDVIPFVGLIRGLALQQLG